MNNTLRRAGTKLNIVCLSVPGHDISASNQQLAKLSGLQNNTEYGSKFAEAFIGPKKRCRRSGQTGM